METLSQKLLTYFNKNTSNAQCFMQGYKTSDFDGNFPSVRTEILNEYGGEDQGSDYYSIWEFSEKDETVILKFQGWYASHYGSEFREVFEVKAVHVQRVEYQKI